MCTWTCTVNICICVVCTGRKMFIFLCLCHRDLSELSVRQFAPILVINKVHKHQKCQSQTTRNRFETLLILLAGKYRRGPQRATQAFWWGQDSRVGTSWQQPSGKPIHIQIPNRSLMAMKGSQSFTIFGSPHIRDLIFGCTEQQITIVIVLDDRNRSFVTL